MFGLLAPWSVAQLPAFATGAPLDLAGAADCMPALPGEGACPQWASAFHGAEGAPDYPRAVALRPAQDLVFVLALRGDGGQHNGLPSLDLALQAYDAAAGRLAWAQVYGRPGVQDVPLALRVAPDGSRVFAAGATYGEDGVYRLVALAYDAASGRPLWTALHEEAGYTVGRALAVSPDGTRLYVAGNFVAPGTTSDQQAIVLALDASTGTELWAARAGTPGEDVAHAVVASPDGATVVAAGRTGEGASDFLVLGLDAATGAIRWEARYDGPGHGEDVAVALADSPEGGRVYAAGWSEGAGTSDDYAVAAYDVVDGRLAWVARHDARGGLDVPQAVRASPDGAFVYVTGRSGGPGPRAEDHIHALCPRAGHDYATLALRAQDGGVAWTARYDAAGGEDCAYGLAVSPDGARVIVTGSSEGAGACVPPVVVEPGCAGDGPRAATLAYDARTGELAGAWRYGPHGGAAFARAAAVAADGRVFVAAARAEPGAVPVECVRVPYPAGCHELPERGPRPDLDVVTLAYG